MLNTLHTARGSRPGRAPSLLPALTLKGLAALVAALLLWPAGALAAPAAAPAARAPLRVVTDDNYPPYIMRKPDGTVEGYLVDAWKLWESKTGVPVRLEATDWAKAQAEMAAGRADVIDTMFRTAQREAAFDFGRPYAELPVAIYAQRDIGGITSLESLRGFLVAAKDGDACLERLHAAGVVNVQRFASYAKVIDAAAAGQQRIFCMDEPPAHYLLYLVGLHDQFRRALVLDSGQFHRAVKKGDAATLALVQAGFDAFSAAEVKALHDKWMGTELVPLAWRRPLAYGAAAAAVAATLMLAWVMAMRRLVRLRTRELIDQRQQLRQAHEHLQRLNRLYRVLTGVGETIARTRDMQTLFDAVCRILTEEGGLRMAWIGRPDEASQRIRAVARSGTGTDYTDAVQVSTLDDDLGRGPTGEAFRSGRPVSTNDLANEPLRQPWQAEAAQRQFRASAAFPIKLRGAPWAVLSVYSERVGYFEADELELLERLAMHVGIALEAGEADVARTHAEAELRQSEERFALMFRTSPVGMLHGDGITGEVLDVNDTWLKMFGYQRDEVVGRTGLQLDLWCDQGERSRLVQILGRSGSVASFDTVMRRRDGSTLDISFTAAQFEAGGKLFGITSFVDISHRRQVERALTGQAEELERLVAQRTAELGSVFQALPDLYFRLAGDGTILDYRAGRHSDLARPPEQFLGRRMQEVLPADVAAALAAALDTVAASGKPKELEYALELPSGLAHFEARLLPFHDGGFIAVVRNVSERRALEQASQAARLEAERLSRLRSEFLANMSHEVRTPLNGIMGFAQIGLASSSADDAARDAFSRILEASQLLLGIVNDVLDFSKIDAGRLQVEHLPLDPRGVMASAVDVVREAAAAKGLWLKVDLADSLPAACLGDALRLRQVLINLLNNAVKFTEQGGIGVAAFGEGRELVVQVSDSGIGIGHEELAQLFTPFQQADMSTTRRFGGTGLGLSISRRLAQMMGGDIQVRSQPGIGSVFELRLPLHEAAGAPPANDTATQWTAKARRLQGLRILVAEDNPINQLIVDLVLTAEGASVVLVGNGQQAVDRVAADRSGDFDLVLMDLQMPVMDGYEATRLIRELAPDLPVVSQTAHAMADERARCLAVGMVAHVTKPIELEPFVATILAHARRRAGADS